MKSESVLYGTRVELPNYMAEIISTKPEQFEQAKQWAQANGFDRLEVRTIDMSVKPDFVNTLN